MDSLYTEVSRLREVERDYNAMLDKKACLNELLRRDNEEMEPEKASRPPLTTEQKMKKAMLIQGASE